MTRRVLFLCCVLLAGLAAFAILSLPGCGDGRRPVYPVRGKLLVNGKPATDAHVMLHPAIQDPEQPLIPSGQVDAEGGFTLSSYEQGDGAPSGDYVVTIEWLTYHVIGNQYGGPDKLKGKYNDPKTSTIQVRVEDKPLEMSPIELETK